MSLASVPGVVPGPLSRPSVGVRTAALTKAYGADRTQVRALAGVDLGPDAGSFTAIMGPSGSGKSTLLHCLAGLDRPTTGQVFLGTTELGGLSDRELTRIRRGRVGFVFPSFNLLPTLTARQNITLPLDLAGRRADPSRIAAVVGALGLADRLDHRPSEVSGGSSSASPSPEPWSPDPTSCSPTSRPARSTRSPDRPCSAICAGPVASRDRPSCWSPTTRTPPRTPTGSSCSPTAG